MVWCLQYSRLEELSVGPISYSEDSNSTLLPLTICKRLYKKRSRESSKHPFQIDTEQETGGKSLHASLSCFHKELKRDENVAFSLRLLVV